MKLLKPLQLYYGGYENLLDLEKDVNKAEHKTEWKYFDELEEALLHYYRFLIEIDGCLSIPRRAF